MRASCFKLFAISLFFAGFSTQACFAAQASARPNPCTFEHRLYDRSKSLFEHKQFLLSSLHFSELSANDCDLELAQRALFFYAVDLDALSETHEAVRTLQEIEKEAKGDRLHSALLFHAFISPDFRSPALSSLDQYKLDLWSARSDAKKLDSLRSVSLLSAAERTEIDRTLDALNEVPYKSPGGAGVLSALVPGLGQAYVGTFQSAAISLVLNSLFLATTIEFANRKLRSPAIASGMVFSITYIGNILNAVNSANLRNSNLREPEVQNLKKSLFPEFTP